MEVKFPELKKARIAGFFYSFRTRNFECNHVAILVVLLIGSSLYSSFIASSPIFDDHNVVTNAVFGNYALSPLPLAPRSIPYFSIAFLNIISTDNIAWNRCFNVGLLIGTTLALNTFLKRVFNRLISKDSAPHASIIALCISAWFILNPVTVYGVAYLAQRTILMATLFSLVSATLYLRAQHENRSVDLLSAGLCACLAMLCKEHALLLPFAIAALTPLATGWNRITIRRCATFNVLLLPMSWWVISNRAPEAGSSYEIYSGDILSQFSLPAPFSDIGGVWGMSIATQLGLFLRYLGSWLWPDPAYLSADLRIDFDQYWTGPIGYLLALISVSLIASAFLHTSRKSARPELRLISSGIAYSAILFVVELSVVRVQEPFVLYRSFLWMPGYALIFSGLIAIVVQKINIRNKKAATTLLILLPLLPLAMTPWTVDRLHSLESEESVWRDALLKLPKPTTPGADRIYYNLAGEAYKRKDYSAALDFSERVVRQSPGAFQGYLALGTSLIALGKLDEASKAFDKAESLPKPEMFNGYIQFKRCILLELGGSQGVDVINCLEKSAGMGYSQAKMILQLRQSETKK